MNKPTLAALVGATALAVFSLQANAQSSGRSKTDTSMPAADNTKSNQDASNRERTADDQKDNSSDLDITQRIRKSVIADSSLSTYGHNVKIVTVNRTVTLNGVVRNDAERASIRTKAAQVAGKDHVVDEMKVAP